MRQWPEWKLAALWWLMLPLAMVSWPLGLLARRRALRLPEAGGQQEGIVSGRGTLSRLLVVGESPVAGVGVENFHQSIGACVARQLGAGRRASVYWRAMGWNGIRIWELLDRLEAEALPPADQVLVILGVNDTTGLTRRSAWRTGLFRLASLLVAKTGGQIYLASVPPLQHFSAVPQPLRWWLGLRACLLDRDMVNCAPGAYCYLPVDVPIQPALLAPDGYHPSALGCEVWAGRLAAQMVGLSPGPTIPSN